MPITVSQFMVVSIGSANLIVQEDGTLEPNVARVRDAAAFIRLLSSLEAPQARPAAAPTPKASAPVRSTPTLATAAPAATATTATPPYRLLDYIPDSRFKLPPVYRKSGHSREELAAMVWKGRRHLRQDELDLLCMWLGINTAPIHGEHIAAMLGVNPTTVHGRIRVALGHAGVIVKEHRRVSESLIARHARERAGGES